MKLRIIPWVAKTLGVMVLLLLCVAGAFYYFGSASLKFVIAPGLPERDEIKRAVWLDQNWSDRDRFWFHHAPQGTATIPIPYDWFMSLEAPEISLLSNPPMLHDSAYLARMGFISSPSGWERDAHGYRRYNEATAGNPDYAGQNVGQGEKKEVYDWKDFDENQDGLPVGFVKLKAEKFKVASVGEARSPADGKPMNGDSIGLTCAACHTGHFTYQGTDIRMDGAPAMTHLDKFRSAMGVALALTDTMPGRFDRFAERMAKRKNIPLDDKQAFDAFQKQLRGALKAAIKQGKTVAGLEKTIVTQRCTESDNCENLDPGFGRLDALNRIGNQVFYSDIIDANKPDKAIKENLAANNAPVSFPYIWSTPWFLWAQYDGSIEHPLIRNAGEALGVRALLNLQQPNNPAAPLYGSSVDLGNLVDMEELLQGSSPFVGETRGFKGLQAPKWPSAIFPQQEVWQIDQTKADKGRKLYSELCMGCHLEPVSDPAFWNSKHWVDLEGEKYLNAPEIPLSELGTDPAQASVLLNRTVNVPEYLQLDPYKLLEGCGYPAAAIDKLGIKPGVQTKVLFGLALMEATKKTVDKLMQQEGMSEAEQLMLWGKRKNCPNPNLVQALLDKAEGKEAQLYYRTRPLDGVWATAPFLHNGSIPNLWSLLSPQAERPDKFCVGNLEFDPVKVGYETGIVDGKAVCDKRNLSARLSFRKAIYEFDVNQPANSNAGHVFDDVKGSTKGVIGRKLSEDERWELIEFLKTL